MRSTQINWTCRLLSFCLLQCVSFALVGPNSWAQQEPAKPAAKPVTTAQDKSPRQRRRNPNGKTVAPRRNAQISKIVSEIGARNIEKTIRKLVSFGTRNTLSDQNDPNRGIGAARDWLYGEFMKAAQRSGGRMTVEKQTFEQPKAARVPQSTMLTNIVATLKGTQPESTNRIYVVSGHYDSMCNSPTDAKCDAPGANDDASGTAAVLEMARVMAKYSFDATIVFMTVPGEEQGLLGATHYAEETKKAGTDIEAMFTNDIIGSSLGGNGVRDPHTVRVFSEGVPSNETPAEAIVRRSVGGENDSPSRQLARFIKETSERYVRSMKVWMIYRRDRYGRGGDHQPFLERGYAAVRFTEPNEDYHHQHQNVRVENGIQYGDLPQFDDFKYIANVARVNAAALAALASAPARPKTVTFPTSLSNDTPIKWDANKEPDIAGYEIVWRDTTEAVWTHSRAVGNLNTYTMKGMSKDNYFFGVRAVDKDGNRSPVSYPRPLPRARPGTNPAAATPPE
ncbi:MAG TPA: M20/M25/M40 family metallo-hydrolase [Pyrinomonadaceae bacterium]|nr:M20/M25/M40 family metallo-hydrolase [Pyrinomonadaceae bacterium]